MVGLLISVPVRPRGQPPASVDLQTPEDAFVHRQAAVFPAPQPSGYGRVPPRRSANPLPRYGVATGTTPGEGRSDARRPGRAEGGPTAPSARPRRRGATASPP